LQGKNNVTRSEVSLSELVCTKGFGCAEVGNVRIPKRTHCGPKLTADFEVWPLCFVILERAQRRFAKNAKRTHFEREWLRDPGVTGMNRVRWQEARTRLRRLVSMTTIMAVLA
jgi:hypothetical protein